MSRVSSLLRSWATSSEKARTPTSMRIDQPRQGRRGPASSRFVVDYHRRRRRWRVSSRCQLASSKKRTSIIQEEDQHAEKGQPYDRRRAQASSRRTPVSSRRMKISIAKKEENFVRISSSSRSKRNSIDQDDVYQHYREMGWAVLW